MLTYFPYDAILIVFIILFFYISYVLYTIVCMDLINHYYRNADIKYRVVATISKNQDNSLIKLFLMFAAKQKIYVYNFMFIEETLNEHWYTYLKYI